MHCGEVDAVSIALPMLHGTKTTPAGRRADPGRRGFDQVRRERCWADPCSQRADLYLWLVYRTFALRAPQRLTWKQLYRQFGVDPAKANERVTVDNFRKDCLRELKKIKLAWPGLNYAAAPGALILHP